MRSLIVVVLVAAAGCATTTQVSSPYAKPSATEPSAYIPAGTVLRLRLAQQLSGRDIEPGDPFVAQVVEPVIGEDGELAIPAGTPVLGHVAAVREADQYGPAAMSLVFDEVQLDTGARPIEASLIDMDVTTNQADIEASDVGIGAAIGAVVGTIIEPGRGTIAGAGLGAGGGALVSLGRSRDEALLPSGTPLAIQLDEPLTIGGYGPRGPYPPAPAQGPYHDPYYDEPLY